MREIARTAATAVALWFFILILVTANASAEIKLGILPRLGAVEMYEMFSPLAEYLGREIGEKVSIVIPKDFDAFKAAVGSNQIDLGFANSLVYIQLKKNLSIEPLALASESKAGTRFRGVIIVRKDSPIRCLADLKGKKIIFVERDSAGGFLFQTLLLKKAGLNVRTDLVLLPFAKKHDNVTLAVYNGAADAGGIREDDLGKMKNKVDLSKIRVLARSDSFPNWPVFAMPTLDAKRAARIKSALLRLKNDDPEAKRILASAKLNGFFSVSDADYNSLRHAAAIAGSF